mgnify:FL=1
MNPMTKCEALLRLFLRDDINGQIDPSLDLETLQIELNRLLSGYRIFKEHYAKHIDTKTDILSVRVSRIVRI